MDAILEVVCGAKPARIRLRLPTVVGRSNDASVKVRNPLVSRQHCEIYEYEGELAVRDLNSSNGTLINGQPVDEPTILGPGDELTVGPVTLRAVYSPLMDQPEPAEEEIIAAEVATPLPTQQVDSDRPPMATIVPPTKCRFGLREVGTSVRSKPRRTG